MAWISVYQEVDGPKLRKLAKKLSISKAEALGILCYLWFWGMNNADEFGKVLDADHADIEEAIRSVSSLEPDFIVKALISCGWIDEEEGNVYLHDWDTWQAQWYKLQKKRKANAERMKKYRSNATVQAETPKKPVKAPLSDDEDGNKTTPTTGEEDDTRQKQAKKKKYAEFVSMTEEEYEKLTAEYGMIFVTACISELDNYKGSKGKRYKSDYRAILSWVVDRVNEKKPGLMKMSRSSNIKETGENPFEEWEGDG